LLLAAETHAAEIENVLAMTWQPGFCATAGQNKPECLSLTADRFDAARFSLHGLWPDDLHDKELFPCYCGRGAARSCATNLAAAPTIDLSQDVLTELSIVMPGMQSGLHLHEWSKHGSCYEDDLPGADAGATPDEYFSEAMNLLAQLNASSVLTLFAESVGEVLIREEIAAAFEESFGVGAADRLTVVCNGEGTSAKITELRINLAGEITPDSHLAELILGAPPTSVSTKRRNCESGRVFSAENN
jgi:ribonuclease T2